MSETEYADPDEVAKFEALAHRWWDRDSEFKPLHDINAPRVAYIAERVELDGRTLLDAGCGGGLLTEAMHAAGAKVTGIDPGERPLNVAKLHAIESGFDAIEYIQTTPEAFVETNRQFDIVTCLETLEHVPSVAASVTALANLTAPGGDIFLATINRTARAYALAILGAEYVLNLLPRGTHDYSKLIKPSELSAHCQGAGLEVVDVVGMRYNPFTRSCSMTADVSVNYMLHARKAD